MYSTCAPRGCQPRGRKTVRHDARERFSARHPLDVTVRIRPGVQSLRRGRACATIRAALTVGGHKPTFRVVAFNVLRNHLLCAAAHNKCYAQLSVMRS